MTLSKHRSDVVVIGGGIVGLATAYALTRRHPQRSVRVLEKEGRLAEHQTGRNSGVIHSGIYYRPGSLKARLCRSGKTALESFCRENDVPLELCGKVIVATHPDEIPRLRALEERGRQNGVACERVSRARLHELEPQANGLEALHVRETGIVDYRAVCDRLAARIESCGGQVLTGARVSHFHRQGNERVVETPLGDFTGRWMVNCAGLHSDALARLAGAPVEGRIIPFRGEYYALQGRAVDLVRNLIYPVPDPQFPFLGVHFTRMMRGGAECGPNAVLALAREGYRWSDINVRDLTQILLFPGFRKLARRHWRMALGECQRSWSKRAFVVALQRLVPAVKADDLIPAPAGVRAQAVALDGQLVDDFWIDEQPGLVHVLNAPSPAATASLSIGEAILDRLEKQF
jgi:L-2-hydroxyglutarate oxidase